MSDATETTYEGTIEELIVRLKTFPGKMKARLQLLPDDEDNLFNASPEERSNALDEIAAMNKGRPVLSTEALRRENIYDFTLAQPSRP